MSRTTPLRSHLIPLALLLAATLAAYGTVLDHNFLASWDDNVYVTGNETIRGFTAAHLKDAFTRFFVGNYAPLQIVSYMLDYTLWGLRAGGFLATNVLLHAASGILFYALVMRLHGRRLWAFTAALVFLLHPLQVESVAWVSQRKNVLAMVFFLGSLLFYRRYQEGRPGEGRLAYVGSLVAFALSLLAKAVTVVLPLVLLFLDVSFLGRGEWRRRLVDKLPFLLAAAAVGILAYVSQDPESGGGRSEYWGGSFGATLLTMVPVLARYLGMVVWPQHLSPAYTQPFKESADAAVLLSALVLLAVIAGGVWLFRRNRPLASWLGVAGITILPVAQLVPLVTLMNDRYLYFPLLGFAALMGGGVTCLADAIAPWGRRGAVAVVLLLFLALPWLTHRQAKVWQDATTLWRHAVAVEPECGLAWLGYGHALMTDGYIPQALSATLRAYELYPQDEDTLLNLGLLYKRLQVPREGRPYLLALVGQNPRNFGGWFALGENYLLTGEKAAAEDALRRALALRPDEPAVAARLAELARGAGSKRN